MPQTLSAFAARILEIRKRSGFKSAQSFFRHLKDTRNVAFNYSYYARVESGTALPSSKVVQEISKAIDPSEAEDLVRIYCQCLFPEYAYLFEAKANDYSDTKTAPTPAMSKRTRELTEHQVAQLSKTYTHYKLFYLLTLARRPLKPSEIGSVFEEKVDAALRDLEGARLIRKTGDDFVSISTELKFPSPESNSIKETYKRLKLWNMDLPRSFKFELLRDKMHFRRISTRYVKILVDLADTLMNITRSSDELDPRFNNEVIVADLKIFQGRFPG